MPQPDVSCGTCPAWYSEDGIKGECRGDVPHVILLPAPPNPLDPGKPRIDVKSIFRPMLAADWCARHPRFDWQAPVTRRIVPVHNVVEDGGRA